MLALLGAGAAASDPGGSPSLQPPVAYYVDSNAQGANDGSSPVDAFTELQPAFDSIADGDYVVVARGSVFRGEHRVTGVDDWTLLTYGNGPGPIVANDVRDPGAWVEHLPPGAGTAHGTYRWSGIGLGFQDIYGAAHNYVQDDIHGTATGIDIASKAAARSAVIQGTEQPLGIDTSFGGVYHGHVVRVASLALCEMTPGTWYYDPEVDGGTLYMTPLFGPFDPANAVYFPSRQSGIVISTCDGFTVDWGNGHFRGFLDYRGGNGYGILVTGTSDGWTVKNAACFDASDHGFGAAGGVPSNARLENLHIYGCSRADGGAFVPVVFFSGAENTDMNCVGSGLTTHFYPILREDGTPLYSGFDSSCLAYYSHGPPGFARVGGVTWRECTAFNYQRELNARHGLSLSLQMQLCGANDVPPIADATDPSTYPVAMYDSFGEGADCLPRQHIAHIRCRFDGFGFGQKDPTRVSVELSGAVYLESCEVLVGFADTPGGAPGDFTRAMRFEPGADVYAKGTVFWTRDTGPTVNRGALIQMTPGGDWSARFEQCLFKWPEGNCLVLNTSDSSSSLAGLTLDSPYIDGIAQNAILNSSGGVIGRDNFLVQFCDNPVDQVAQFIDETNHHICTPAPGSALRNITAASIGMEGTKGINGGFYSGHFGSHQFGAPKSGCPGDFNDDGRTDLRDFELVARNLGLEGPPYIPGDMDGDGVVRLRDVAQFTMALGCSTDSSMRPLIP